MKLFSTAVRTFMAIALLVGLAGGAQAEDKFLKEVVEFNGTLLYLDTKVPGLILGAVRNGETAVQGFGKIAENSDKTPDGDTIMRIGSVTKAFAGAVLASMVADGTVKLTDELQDRLDWGIKVPEKDGLPIRLIHLVTHTSGLPREVERAPGPDNDPFVTLTERTYADALAADPLLFAPGTGGLYSNFAFDVLSAALATAGKKPYAQLLKERVLDPEGLKDTVLVLRDGDRERLMQGHNFDGSPLPNVPATPIMAGASSLYSTANDILKWLAWHLDRNSPDHAEMRLLDHAAYVPRDGLSPAAGFDEAGQMSAMSLGWVMIAPAENRPLILQKSGGLQGMFLYAAFAPTRGVGAFVAINKFDTGAFAAMSAMVNELIGELAPR